MLIFAGLLAVAPLAQDDLCFVLLLEEFVEEERSHCWCDSAANDRLVDDGVNEVRVLKGHCIDVAKVELLPLRFQRLYHFQRGGGLTSARHSRDVQT